MRKRITYVVVALIVLIGIPWTYGNMTAATKYKAVDSSKIASLDAIASGLELYHAAHKSYPVIGACAPVSVVREVLVKDNFAGDNLFNARTWTLSAFERMFAPQPEFSYFIGTEDEGKSYVLMAKLQFTKAESMPSDIDGAVFGCDCDDPNYCIGPSK